MRFTLRKIGLLANWVYISMLYSFLFSVSVFIRELILIQVITPNYMLNQFIKGLGTE